MVRQIDLSPRADAADSTSRDRPALSLGEVIVGCSVVTLALIGWASLELAHASRFSLGAATALAALGVIMMVLIARRSPRPRIHVDRGELAILGVVGAMAAVLAFPGFPYGIGDKDPGIYVEHGISIARTGSFAAIDPVIDPTRVPAYASFTPGARFPGIWVENAKLHRIVPQFYHYFPALLAAGYKIAGRAGLQSVNPVFAILAALAFALALKRAFGPVTGAIGGMLLATNMLQVWHAKYPTSEMVAQCLFITASLALIIAVKERWRFAAGIAGLLTGAIFLDRADGLLLILLAVGTGCVLIVTRRWDGRAAWFAGGLALVGPSIAAQSYHFAKTYTLGEGLPTLGKLIAIIVGAVVLAIVLGTFARPIGRRVLALATGRGPQVVIGLTILCVAATLLLVGFLRLPLFGRDYTDYHGTMIRTLDELNLVRLSWFITLPGFALMYLGLAVVVLRRWRAPLWILTLPFLFLFPLYAYHAKNSARLMWWSRRYVSFTLPGMIALIAVAIGFGLSRRWFRWIGTRVVAALVTVFLLVVYLHQSLPLIDHHEYAGSLEITARIAGAAGSKQGVFLWNRTACCETAVWLFGSPVWFQQGQVSAVMPAKPTMSYVEGFEHGFPGAPVFIVVDGTQRPEWLAAAESVDHVHAGLPMWRETNTEGRPNRERTVTVDFTIWHVTGT